MVSENGKDRRKTGNWVLKNGKTVENLSDGLTWEGIKDRSNGLLMSNESVS